MTFHSEHGEDKWIFENIQGTHKGVYVDLGCAHPIDSSNTAFLRESGWSGLAIDANPQWEPCWAPGTFVCAVLSDKPTARWRVNPFGHPYASRIDPNAPEVHVMFMEPILIEHGIEKIDFLSVDLEGHEWDVLKTLAWHWHKPTVVVAEYATAGLPDDLRVRANLEPMGYRMVHQTPSNYIFTL